MAAEWNSMGLGDGELREAQAQIGLLSEKLRGHEITVGEVVVLGVGEGYRLGYG